MDKFPNVPKEIWEALEYAIALSGLENADNFRAYRVSDRLYFDEFLQAYNSGCCGNYEDSAVDFNEEKWVIGCNYGH